MTNFVFVFISLGEFLLWFYVQSLCFMHLLQKTKNENETIETTTAIILLLLFTNACMQPTSVWLACSVTRYSAQREKQHLGKSKSAFLLISFWQMTSSQAGRQKKCKLCLAQPTDNQPNNSSKTLKQTFQPTSQEIGACIQAPS